MLILFITQVKDCNLLFTVGTAPMEAVKLSECQLLISQGDLGRAGPMKASRWLC